jgi:hypothetical protein
MGVIMIGSVRRVCQDAKGKVLRGVLPGLAFSIALLATGVAQAEPATSACQQGVVGNKGGCEDPTQQLAEPAHGVRSAFCRAGFGAVGSRLCFTGARGPNTFANALADCIGLRARVGDYGDWRYRGIVTGLLAPVGWWLGPITADNTALFVNLPNAGDFDGETNRFDSRLYACVHER